MSAYEIQRRESGHPRYRIKRYGNADAEYPWNRDDRIVSTFWTLWGARRWIANSTWKPFTPPSPNPESETKP